MKRVMSIILCLIMVFITAAVPALAADGEGKWITLLSENFGSYEDGTSFDASSDNAITYPNAKAYIWYSDSDSENVINTVSAYDSNNAFKIARTGSGNKRVLFELNEHRSGKVEISFKMLASQVLSNSVLVEVFGETAEGAIDTSKLITGTVVEASKIRTSYNNTQKAKSNTFTWDANTWLSVKYYINTANGDVEATYTNGVTTATRTINSSDTSHVDSFTAVAGFDVRSAGSTAFDLYVDDISVKYYELPATAETEFDFSDISDESEAEVTKALNLISKFTDSENIVWNVKWSSSDDSIVDSETGAVNPGAEDKEVTLTATLTNAGGSKTFSKKFTLTVPAFLKEFDFSKISTESVNGVTSPLNLIKQFTDDDGKLWNITWNSEDNNVIDSETGAVTAGGIDERVELTANLTYIGTGGETEVSVTRIFNVKVLAEGTYHLREGFDASGDYSGHNGIKDYKGDGSVTWKVVDQSGADTSNYEFVNANISSDPENSQDKVLKLYRSAASTSQSKIQRVLTQINSDASQLNEKVYLGMRVLREKNIATTYIYVQDTADTRLMYIQLQTDGTIKYTFNDGFSSKTSPIKAPSGKWFDITIELDMKNDCYNLYIDGQSALADGKKPAMAASENGFGSLMLDLARGDYTDESIIYFDDLTVRTAAGLPYSIVEYNFTDAEGYPTHSMVEDGYLKSVKMRKMTSVDTGTEPTLYVCFFKGELLYDVISTPLDEGAPLGGFDVTLNEPLPQNPLDYKVKAFVFSKDLVPLMNLSTYVPYEVNPTIYVAGDSIARTYSATEYPQSGYAQELGANFEEGTVNIENHAVGGRSSRSFIAERALSTILDKICSGDYLFIQFGHNDDKTTNDRYTDPNGDKDTEGSFKYYLMQYINGARDKGAVPVLITPPARNSFDNDGKIYDGNLIKYVNAMIKLAEEENVLLVDLYTGWKEFVDGRVEEGIDSRNFYSYFYPADSRFVNDPAYAVSKYNIDSTNSEYDKLFSYYVDDDPTNVVHHDGTHLNAYGAKIAAKIIADSLAASAIGLAEYIVEDRNVEWSWNGYATFGSKITARD